MNILWLVNVPLPEASLLLNEYPSPFGGWLINASALLSNNSDITLTIAFPKSGLNEIKSLKGEKIKYFAFPPVKENKAIGIDENTYLEEIIERSKPDIVNLFGTEYTHTLSMVNVCRKRNVKVVITIQGLVSIYAQHYMASLPLKVQNGFTFRDLLKQDNLKQQQGKFSKRGKYEIRALRKVSHVIGRTTWDKACTILINPALQYHFCNEILREEFYKHKWDIDKCERNSIFVSQGSYPIKGLHFMLEAMPLILEKIPDARLYVGGIDITRTNTLKEKIKISTYGKYIKEIIIRNNLQNNVFFTGILNEKQMCERFLKSNVFVCPSSIENSPNSLGEAMILGVPSVASDVGGVADLIKHNEEGYVYQSDAPYMLAHFISEILLNKNIAINMSMNAKIRALETHNRENNINSLIGIYQKVINAEA